MSDSIIVKGAREHNLKNIDVTLPRNKLIVITGLSGSGKSTLAFDTIYAEGQRRYVESLSSYARQFLGLMDKPDVDSIDGLSPAISIEQKTTSKNPRSTVGTVTEIYDYLRLLFARVGTPYCPTHHVAIEQKTPSAIAQSIAKEHMNKDVMILSPMVSQKKGTYEKLVKDLHAEGFSRVRINGVIRRTDEPLNLERYKKHDIDLVIDRVNTNDVTRLTEAVEHALKCGDGKLIISSFGAEGKKGKAIANAVDQLYSSRYACPHCDISFEELQPRMFSFNSPFGACEECHGLGIKQEIDAELIVPDKTRSIADGCIAAYRNAIDGWRGQQLAAVAKHYGFNPITPFSKLTTSQQDVLLYGSDKKLDFAYRSKSGDSTFNYKGDWEGVIPQLERLYLQTESDYRKREIEKFMRILPCPVCEGRRLKDKVLAVRVNEKNIIEVTDLSISDSLAFFSNLKLTAQQETIAKQILKEIRARLTFLENVGLSYLSLSRTAGTLSGGEAQRIRLATQIGSNLTGVLYVLDEPSIGLHQRDNAKLISTLIRLRDLGNTLIVVEHDEDTIRNADYLVDLGPGAGIHGGHVTASGTPKEVEQNPQSLTGRYLSGTESIPTPDYRRAPANWIELTDAHEHNLKHVTVHIPTGVMSAITGVSGSGKSTLIHDILYRALMKQFYDSRELPGKHKSIKVPKATSKVVMIDQSPIGRTPRSNPATYIKVFDDVRALFASTKESKSRGYLQGRYSFNVPGGRCEACHGDGLIKIEMNFLPDVYVTCDECKGKRYNKETLEITYKGKNIADVLNMSVEEALTFFENIPKIKQRIKTLFDVGLEYITLGQSSTTLSGGESQRIKLTKELSRRSGGDTIYLLDEPTTGLHMHDVKKLLSVLGRLVDKGNTIVCIEHNLDVIKSSDYIIDLGPEGGNDGGEIIAVGTPEEIVREKKSYTGQFLKKFFEHSSKN